MTAQELSGRCSCGAVHYTLRAAPMVVHCCHCLDCQRQTGSAFVLNALFETDRVETTGPTEAIAMPTDSGRPHRIFRCVQCRTAMWSEYGGVTKLRFVRVGTLETPAALPPGIHIYTRSKQPWVKLPPEVPAFDAYYDSKEVWPAESLARRQAVFQ